MSETRVRTRRPLGPPMTTQVQRHVASACLSARYSEIARKASRDNSQQRTLSSSLPRKGSPATRPRRIPDRPGGSPTGTPTTTPTKLSAPPSASLSDSGVGLAALRSPSPRAKQGGAATTPRSLVKAAARHQASALPQAAAGVDASHSPSPRGPSRDAQGAAASALDYLRDYSAALKTAYGTPAEHIPSTPPRSAAPQASSFDYLQRVSGGVLTPYASGVVLPPGATSTLSPVLERLRARGIGAGSSPQSEALTSPLVRSLNQQIHQVEVQISDSLMRAPGPAAGRGVGIGLNRRTSPAPPRSQSLPPSARVESANRLPATSLRHVSPPRAAAAPQKPAGEEALVSLRRELGRVRVGMGASQCDVTGDWAWKADSPAAAMSEVLLDAHRRYGESAVTTYAELASIARASCGVYRAQALVRDLGIAASHAREMEIIASAEHTAVTSLDEERVRSYQRYTMHHSTIGSTQLTLRPDGTQSSEVGGNGTYTLSDVPILGKRVATLCLEFEEGDNIVLSTPDQGRTWEGLPTYDTVRLELGPGACSVQPWLALHVCDVERQEERRAAAEAAAREAKVQAQVDYLRGVVQKLTADGAQGAPQAQRAASRNQGTTTAGLGSDTDPLEASSAEPGDEGGMSAILDKAEQLRREGESAFSLGFPPGDTPQDTPLQAGPSEGGAALPSLLESSGKLSAPQTAGDLRSDLEARAAERDQIEADLALERRLLEEERLNASQRNQQS